MSEMSKPYPQSNTRIKAAVVGLGGWGKNLLRNAYDLGLLGAAYDQNPDTVRLRKSEYPSVPFAENYQSILNDPAIDAVIIATPAVTHFSLAKEALLSKKDVFVEKPLSMNVKEGEELVEISNDLERILMVGHILWYHPAVARLKNIIDSGELGDVQYLYSNRLNIGRLRTEENILWSFAPHDISTFLMLLGDEPVRIHAQGGAYIRRGIHDTTLTQLEFKGGIKGHIFVSWLHPYKEQKLVVAGSQGMAVFDDLAENKLLIYPHKVQWNENDIPILQKANHQTVSVEAKEPLREELRHFVECVEKRARPKTDGEEGLRVLKILEKAQIQLTRENDIYAEENRRAR